MSNISYYENIIQEKRKQTKFRNFLMEIASWKPLVLKKRGSIISRYDDKNRVNAVEIDVFQETRDSLRGYGIVYKDTEWFFIQMQSLLQKVPLPNILHFWMNENADFADEILASKDIYLSTIVASSEKVLYSMGIRSNCTTILNSSVVSQSSENIYSSCGVIESQKVYFSRYIISSSHIWFSRNLVGCHDCIFCENLQNTRFCINNKQYNEEEYRKQEKQILSQKHEFENWYKKSCNTGENIGSEKSQGNFIIRSNQITQGYYISDTEFGKNLFLVGWKEGNISLFDICTCSGNSQSSFGVMGMGSSHHVYCSCNIAASSSIYYSYFLENCSFCLGCIWLKNQSYCILNKQYTKEEWEVLVEKIFTSMEADGTLGDFFPASMNPFSFNDTLAYLIDQSFIKKEVEEEWYLWRDEPIKADVPNWVRVVQNTELDRFEKYNQKWEWCIDPEVMNGVISDEKWNYYRIVKMEYDFLVKYELPLPRLHWLDRIKAGFR